jgi:hypothetical protein
LKLPEHQTIEVSAEEERRLASIHRDFIAMMEPLDAKQRIARATVIAGGLRAADPLTRALATQMVEVDKLNREAAEMQAEVDEIAATRRLKGVDPSPALLGRKAKLEEQIAQIRAKQIGIVEKDFSTDKRKAVIEFREAAAREQKQARLAEAIARKTAEAEQADIDARAAQVVHGKRIGAGKPANKSGEAF